MTATKVWFFLMLLCGGLSYYFYTYPPDFSKLTAQAQPTYSPAPQPQPAPVQIQQPPPSLVVYESKVMRRDNENYDVLLGKAEDWFDSGIPIIADQLAKFEETDGLQSRFVVKIGEKVLFPGKLQFISERWFLEFWSSHLSYDRLPTDFFDTLKFKLLGDTPVCHFKVEVKPTPASMDTCVFYQNAGQPSCSDYNSLYAISLARYREQQEKLPLQ